MKLIITEPSGFSKNALNALSNHFEVTQLNAVSELDNYIRTANVLFIRLGIVFNKERLKHAKELKWICTPTTGLDHIDLDYCRSKNIKVISLKGERELLASIPSTAEHTWT